MWSLRLRRWNRRRRGGVQQPLLDFWHHPLPDPAAPWAQAGYLVCDAEMSGLDPDTAELLSLGWVSIDAGEIDLASAEHHLIQNTQSVGQSAAIHQLRDCEFDGAESIEQILAAFLRAAAGKVIVFHHARLDMAFINRASRAAFGAPLLAPLADTLLLEQSRYAKANEAPPQGALRLQACRDRYGLTPHKAHNALTDALATAELLLAHCMHRGSDLQLRHLLSQ